MWVCARTSVHVMEHHNYCCQKTEVSISRMHIVIAYVAVCFGNSLPHILLVLVYMYVGVCALQATCAIVCVDKWMRQHCPRIVCGKHRPRILIYVLYVPRCLTQNVNELWRMSQFPLSRLQRASMVTEFVISFFFFIHSRLFFCMDFALLYTIIQCTRCSMLDAEAQNVYKTLEHHHRHTRHANQIYIGECDCNEASKRTTFTILQFNSVSHRFHFM